MKINRDVLGWLVMRPSFYLWNTPLTKAETPKRFGISKPSRVGRVNLFFDFVLN